MASNVSFKLDNNQQILTNFNVNPFNYSVNDSLSLLFLKLKLNSSLHQIGNQSSEPLIHTYVICANRSLLEFSALQQLSLQICLIASVVGFIIHLFVYGFVPKLQNLPGKCLMSLSSSLLMTNLFLIISYNIEISRGNIYCVLVGIGRHYFILASFCWMSVLAFDTHWTFHLPNRNRFATSSTGSNKKNSTFIKYSIYSWLTPAIIVGLAVITDYTVKSKNSIKPLYGKIVCGLSQFVSIMIWGTIPCCIILFINIILFAKTSKKLYHITEETELANKSTFRERFLWCSKLAVFLGIAWIISFISNFVCELWFQYFAQLFLSCQGIFILSITTLKKSVFELIKRRIYHLRNGGINRNQSSRGSFPGSASMRTLPVF